MRTFPLPILPRFLGWGLPFASEETDNGVEILPQTVDGEHLASFWVSQQHPCQAAHQLDLGFSGAPRPPPVCGKEERLRSLIDETNKSTNQQTNNFPTHLS